MHLLSFLSFNCCEWNIILNYWFICKAKIRSRPPHRPARPPLPSPDWYKWFVWHTRFLFSQWPQHLTSLLGFANVLIVLILCYSFPSLNWVIKLSFAHVFAHCITNMNLIREIISYNMIHQSLKCVGNNNKSDEFIFLFLESSFWGEIWSPYFLFTTYSFSLDILTKLLLE